MLAVDLYTVNGLNKVTITFLSHPTIYLSENVCVYNESELCYYVVLHVFGFKCTDASSLAERVCNQPVNKTMSLAFQKT